MSAGTARAVLLAAALAGCGVKAAPRPPLRPSPEPEARRGAAEPARAAEACACALPEPSLAVTGGRP